MTRSLPVWQVIRSDADGERALHQDVRHFSEWLRLLVGHALAPAQPSESGGWEYLVTGIPLKEMAQWGEPDWIERMESAIEADMCVLRKSIDALRQRLKESADMKGDLTAFAAGFSPIAMVTLPTDRRCWYLTDEGIRIVKWGLKPDPALGGYRRLLDWTSAELDEIRSHLLGQLQKSGSTTGQPRSGDAASAQASLTVAALGQPRPVDEQPSMVSQSPVASRAVERSPELRVQLRALTRSWKVWTAMFAVLLLAVAGGVLLGVVLSRRQVGPVDGKLPDAPPGARVMQGSESDQTQKAPAATRDPRPASKGTRAMTSSKPTPSKPAGKPTNSEPSQRVQVEEGDRTESATGAETKPAAPAPQHRAPGEGSSQTRS